MAEKMGLYTHELEAQSLGYGEQCYDVALGELSMTYDVEWSGGQQVPKDNDSKQNIDALIITLC